jgi:quinol monooxygenase YgiN
MTTRSSALRSSLAVLLLMAAPVRQAWAAPVSPGPVFDIVYLEVGLQAVTTTRTTLSRAARDARTQPGNLGFVALQREGLPTQFMTVSLWADQPSLQSYGRSPAHLAEKTALDRHLIAPYDERPNLHVLADEARDRAALASPGPHARFAVTHIDLIPDMLAPSVRLARDMAAASATQPGALTFDLLNQASRANHFSSLGVWRTPEDLVRYKNQPFVRRFREQLPLRGCVYDERIYHVIP